MVGIRQFVRPVRDSAQATVIYGHRNQVVTGVDGGKPIASVNDADGNVIALVQAS